MAYWFLMASAALSFFGMVLHGFVGARIWQANINKSDMEQLTKSLSIVSWHVFTIFLLVSGLVLICVAEMPALRLLAYPIIAINVLGVGLFVGMGLGGHRPLLRMPGAYLMGATAALAWLGIS